LYTRAVLPPAIFAAALGGAVRLSVPLLVAERLAFFRFVQTRLLARLLNVPWNIDHGYARAAISEQRRTESPGAVRMKQILPPVFLYDLRYQHSYQTARIVSLGSLDELQ